MQQITQLSHNPGLITENIAPLATSSTDWKVIQKVNLKEFFSRNDDLLRIWKAVNNSCTGVTRRTLCERSQLILDQIHKNMAEEENLLNLIQGHVNTIEPREKRSVLPFVGRISRILFGTLDEQAMTEIEHLIEASTNETRKVASLLADQTEVINAQFNITNAKIVDLEKAVAQISLQNSLYESTLQANIATSMIGDYVEQHTRDLEIVTDAILFASRGVLHPHLVSIEGIRNSAASVEDTLHDVTFPVKDSDAMLQLFDISDIHIFFHNMHLTYYMIIPLLNLQRFTLFSVIPLPAKQQLANSTNTLAYIWPDSTYLAVNTSTNIYIPMNRDEINKCKSLNNLRICRHTQPVREANTNAPCEVQLIIKGKIDSIAMCNIKLLQLPMTYWTRLHAENVWAFSTIKEEQLFTRCRRGPFSSQRIKGAGTLQLKSECSAHTADARLTASRTINSTNPSIIIFNSTLNISEIVDTISQNSKFPQIVVQTISNTSGNMEYKNSLDVQAHALRTGIALHEIVQKAQALAEYKNINNNMDYIEKTSFKTSISITSIVGIGLLIWACIYVVQKCKRRMEVQQLETIDIQDLKTELAQFRTRRAQTSPQRAHSH